MAATIDRADPVESLLRPSDTTTMLSIKDSREPRARRRERRLSVALVVLLLCSCVFARLLDAQDKKLEKFFLSNSTLAESRAPLYMAKDLGLFEKYSLDAQIVNIRGSAINNASLMAGEIQMAVANGTIAITAAARGAPIVILATIGPTRYSLVSRPPITSAQQLKGKNIAIGGYGIGDYFVLRRLLPKLGLNPEKDVTIESTSCSRGKPTRSWRPKATSTE